MACAGVWGGAARVPWSAAPVGLLRCEYFCKDEESKRGEAFRGTPRVSFRPREKPRAGRRRRPIGSLVDGRQERCRPCATGKVARPAFPRNSVAPGASHAQSPASGAGAPFGKGRQMRAWRRVRRGCCPALWRRGGIGGASRVGGRTLRRARALSTGAQATGPVLRSRPVAGA